MMRIATIPKPPVVVKPIVNKVVAIVAGTRIGLNRTKNGVLTANPTAEPPRVIPANANRANAETPVNTPSII